MEPFFGGKLKAMKSERKVNISRYDVISKHNLEKYIALSKDDPTAFYHTPDKTLIVLLDLKEKANGYKFKNSKEYAEYYNSVIDNVGLITYSIKLKILLMIV